MSEHEWRGNYVAKPEPSTVPEPLDGAEYIAYMNTAALLGRATLDLPIERMLRNISQAEVLGPILDPTAYMRGGKNLTHHRRYLEALREVQKLAREIMEAGV